VSDAAVAVRPMMDAMGAEPWCLNPQVIDETLGQNPPKDVLKLSDGPKKHVFCK